MNKKEIKQFEREYVEKLEKEGLEAAKAHFRATFAVTCFQCGYCGPTKAPLNCAKCDTYLD